MFFNRRYVVKTTLTVYVQNNPMELSKLYQYSQNNIDKWSM